MYLVWPWERDNSVGLCRRALKSQAVETPVTLKQPCPWGQVVTPEAEEGCVCSALVTTSNVFVVTHPDSEHTHPSSLAARV